MRSAQAPSSADIEADLTSFGAAREEAANASEVRGLGPDSLIWDHLGDLRGLLTVFRIGLLQNMHPAVSRALEQHSGEVFLKNPWNRLLRSLPPIMGVIYGPDPAPSGAECATTTWTSKAHSRRGRPITRSARICSSGRTPPSSKASSP